MTRRRGIKTPQSRNRSSKNLLVIPKFKPAVASLSNEALSKRADSEAVAERERRAKRAAKK